MPKDLTLHFEDDAAFLRTIEQSSAKWEYDILVDDKVAITKEYFVAAQLIKFLTAAAKFVEVEAKTKEAAIEADAKFTREVIITPVRAQVAIGPT